MVEVMGAVVTDVTSAGVVETPVEVTVLCVVIADELPGKVVCT
jgi:hypothetical protein